MFMTKERRIDVLGAINDNVATINEYFSIYEEIIFKKKYTLTNFEATDYGCTFKAWEHVSYNNKNHIQQIPPSHFMQAGISMISMKIGEKEELLFVGMSTCDLRYRAYRFVKELLDMSRIDENHSGAEKFRQFSKLNRNKIKELTFRFSPAIKDENMTKIERKIHLEQIRDEFKLKYNPIFNAIVTQ